MNLSASVEEVGAGGIPRVSEDEPHYSVDNVRLDLYSPRERG